MIYLKLKLGKFAVIYKGVITSFCSVKYYRDKIFMEKFGNRVKELRKFKKLSQEKLALECGFELSQIYRIENGVVNTSISHVAKIAEVLKVSPEELFKF